MTTITMPNALNQALSEVAQQSAAAAVQALAAKYEFPAEEAMRHLQLEDVKFVKKRGPSPKSQAEKDAAKAEKAAAKKKEKKEKKSKSSDEESEKPKKKKQSGYLMFAAEVRPEVKEELTAELEEGKKLLGKDVIKEIATRWNALTEEEKGVWKEQAEIVATDSE
jgi:hypothetical protein